MQNPQNFPLNITQVCVSQTTVRYSVGFLVFAAQVMNKMRIGKDGRTSELRRTGRRWRKPMAQFGEKVWFRKIGEDDVSSHANRTTQGIFIGHHDRTGALLCITKNGVVRGKNWTRQTLSDACDVTNWDGLCGTPWQMMAPVLKLTKKATADKERSGTLIAKDCG